MLDLDPLERLRNTRRSVRGHLWTLGSRMRSVLQPPEAPPSRAWRLPLAEAGPEGETVDLTGRFYDLPGAREAVVMLHGLGGCSDSVYMLRAAADVREAGLACLALNLRGSDRRGTDYFHAGLTTDLHSTLGSPDLERFEDLYLLGFSIGGHVVLRAATEELDPRVRSVAAVCSPLDLQPCAEYIDRPSLWAYRRYLLTSLIDIYRGVAERRPVPVPLEQAQRIVHIHEWDRQIIAPRWGFEGPEDYYARASAGGTLDRLGTPALLVEAEDDPLVPEASVRPALERAGAVVESGRLEVRWVSPGGHLGFPDELDLGEDAPPGLGFQLLAWLRGRAS